MLPAPQGTARLTDLDDAWTLPRRAFVIAPCARTPRSCAIGSRAVRAASPCARCRSAPRSTRRSTRFAAPRFRRRRSCRSRTGASSCSFSNAACLRTSSSTRPTSTARATTPYFAHIIAKFGSAVREISREALRALEEQLAEHGIKNENVDYIAFDHFHTQDLRTQLGTEDGRFAHALSERHAPRAEDRVGRLGRAPPDAAHLVHRRRTQGREDEARRAHRRRFAPRRRRHAASHAGSHEREPNALRQHRLGRVGHERERDVRRLLDAARERNPRRRRDCASRGSRGPHQRQHARERRRSAHVDGPRAHHRRSRQSAARVLSDVSVDRGHALGDGAGTFADAPAQRRHARHGHQAARAPQVTARTSATRAQAAPR